MKTNTMGGARPRNDGDAYYTPDALAQAITDALRDRLDLTPQLVVEPSAGDGAFAWAARATWGYDTRLLAVDPAPGPRLLAMRDAPKLAGAGGFTIRESTWEDVTDGIEPGAIILGNPPYNLPGDGRGDAPTTAERHVTLALDRLPPGGHVAFLLRLSFLSGGGRTERLHSRHPLRALWPVTPRPSFTGGGTDGSEYGVFVWCKGWTGLQDVRPLVWDAPKRGRRAA